MAHPLILLGDLPPVPALPQHAAADRLTVLPAYGRYMYPDLSPPFPSALLCGLMSLCLSSLSFLVLGQYFHQLSYAGIARFAAEHSRYPSAFHTPHSR